MHCSALCRRRRWPALVCPRCSPRHSSRRRVTSLPSPSTAFSSPLLRSAYLLASSRCSLANCCRRRRPHRRCCTPSHRPSFTLCQPVCDAAWLRWRPLIGFCCSRLCTVERRAAQSVGARIVAHQTSADRRSTPANRCIFHYPTSLAGVLLIFVR
jgi:hypothetical protein